MQRWIIDDRPDPRHRDQSPRRIGADLERARMEAEYRALLDLPQPSFDQGERFDLAAERNRRVQQQAELREGTGEWADTSAGRAARRLAAATESHRRAIDRAARPGSSRAERRVARREVAQREESIAWARESWMRHGRPIDAQLTEQIETLERHLARLPTTTADHRQLERLVTRRLEDLADRLDIDRPTPEPEPFAPPRELGLGLG